MAAEDKDTLLAAVTELKQELQPQLTRDRARTEGEGRPFDPLGWVMGRPESRKYPAGPAFLVRTR